MKRVYEIEKYNDFLKKVVPYLAAGALALSSYGCATTSGLRSDANNSRMVEGGVVGATVGGIIGHQKGKTLEGIAIGGVIGAITGSQVDK